MTNIYRSRLGVGALVVALMVLPGCANMSDKENRMMTGAAIGAAAGAIIDDGGAGGVLAGAAVGAASGWLYDHYQKDDTDGKGR